MTAKKAPGTLPAIEMVSIAKLKTNPDNPRIIKDGKYVKLLESLRTFPDMLRLRPIVVDDNMIVLGGNMRLKAAQELKIKHIPVIRANDLSEEQKKEFIIKDNLSFGEWDWETLANGWDQGNLIAWGLDEAGLNLSPDEFGEDFSLQGGGKPPFQQITFTLADEQATEINNAIAEIKKTDKFQFMETFGNENNNGNALYLIVSQWAERKK